MNERGQTVYVVDDDQAVRDSLQWLIESAGLNVQTFTSAPAFLERCRGNLAGCLVIDIRLPGMSGLDLQDKLKDYGCRLPVIIITGHGDVPVAIRAMKAGAFDFIEKPFSDQELLDRIREALKRDASRRADDAQRNEIARRIAELSPRERQVMDGVMQGKLNKQIASELDLSHKTVEVHRAHMMKKMRATGLAQLVRLVLTADQSPAS